LSISVLASIPAFAFWQEVSGPLPKLSPAPSKSGLILSDPAASGAEPDNRHIRINRYTLAPAAMVTLPRLEKESLMLCLKCGLLRRIPETGQGEEWDRGPGSALWNRGGAQYSVENLSAERAEILVVELKDSYAISQIRVPYSERDPLLVDPVHYRTALDNEHVRVLFLRLAPREGTEQGQLALHLEIPLSDLHANEEIAGGKLNELTQAAGEAAWKGNELKSLVNTGDKPLEEIIVELKHPFCFGFKFESPDEKVPGLRKYVEMVMERIDKLWMKHMPRSTRTEDTGGVVLIVKVQRDGTIGEDGIGFQTVFASEALVEKAISAVRDAGSFPPAPEAFDKPFMDIRLVFLYNLRPVPGAGCGSTESTEQK
jgi:hypothetical protein